MEPAHFNGSSGAANLVESGQVQFVTNASTNTHSDAQGHDTMASCNLGRDPLAASESSRQDSTHMSLNAARNSNTDTNSPPKLGSDSPSAAEFSDNDDGDISNGSAPKQEQPSQNLESDINHGSEIQNPPTQVMERPGHSATSSHYRIPSHVFARDKSTTPEWSACSNESLFSIQMGTMSFCTEINWGKSGELGSPNTIIKSGPLSPPLTPTPRNQPSVNNLNDICQPDHSPDVGSRSLTEAKAAETVREDVSETNDKIGQEDFSFAGGLTVTPNMMSQYSHHSEGSTTSFAFPILIGDDKKKSASSKGVEGKPKEEQPDPQAPTETPDSVTASKSTTNAASQNKWLSCFSCCTFCQ